MPVTAPTFRRGNARDGRERGGNCGDSARARVSTRALGAGGAVAVGGLGAGSGIAWITAGAIAIVLLGALGAAEIGSLAPLQRLWRLVRRA
jgi:hypothetical protein